MSWYALLRVFHSYWRWAVLITGTILLIRAISGVYKRSDWTGADVSAVRRFITTLDSSSLPA